MRLRSHSCRNLFGGFLQLALSGDESFFFFFLFFGGRSLDACMYISSGCGGMMRGQAE